MQLLRYYQPPPKKYLCKVLKTVSDIVNTQYKLAVIVFIQQIVTGYQL